MTTRYKDDWAYSIAEHCQSLKEHAAEVLAVSAAVLLTVSATNARLAIRRVEGDKSE